jgi:hypothetical protein
MPKGVARLITSIQRRFLWVGVSIERNICKVAWQVLFKGRKKDGLGIGSSLQGKNKAMLF